MPCTQKTTYMPQCPRTLTCMHMSDALRASIYPYARTPPLAPICLVPRAQLYTPTYVRLHAYVWCPARKCMPLSPRPPHLHAYVWFPASKCVPL